MPPTPVNPEPSSALEVPGDQQLAEAARGVQATPDRGRRQLPIAELLARTGVPVAGGLTAATARSPWLLLLVASYSALLDPASPLARALSRVLDPAAEALGQALSIRIRRWGRRQ